MIWPDEQERDVEFYVGGFERGAFLLLHLADGGADALRGLEHGRRIEQRFEFLGVGVLDPSVSVETTDWLSERLPEEASAMMRWPGTPNTCSLRKVETLSRPALVRVSAIMTRPSRTNIPQQ